MNAEALRDAGLDAFVCSLPINVLLMTGYWPVIGTSAAVFLPDGRSLLLVPEDERPLAEKGWADEVRSFSTGSLKQLMSPIEAISEPLKHAAASLSGAVVGYETGPVSEPASYAAMNLYGPSFTALIKDAFPKSKLVSASEVLTRLRSTLSRREIERVAAACRIAEKAFESGRSRIYEGLTEREAAALFQDELSDPTHSEQGVRRAGGFIYCMSGENSFNASAAFQISRGRRLRSGDLVLVHCNSYADGFWTDITRTYQLGRGDERTEKMFEAISEASQAAMGEIRPGVRARDVDAAARDVLAQHGFEKEFVHGLGHAVGFHAIDHNAPPRLHPASADVLETGMVFNIEPAIYVKGFGGMRHCDMAAVTASGCDVLTKFQSAAGGLMAGSAAGSVHA